MSIEQHKALGNFLSQPVSRSMIHKIVVATLQVLPCRDTVDAKVGDQKLPSLMAYLTKLVKYSKIYTGTLMTTLVYLQRLKERLPPMAEGLPCARHRILLSCVIVASKFHNDSSPKNSHWAQYTGGLFSVEDVNLMERQLYCLLDWDLRVTSEQMIDELDSFLAPVCNQMHYYALSPSPSPMSSPVSSPMSLHRTDSVLSGSSMEEIDPFIEMTALKEESQLNSLLTRLQGNYSY